MLINYTIDANPVIQAQQITDIVTDYATEPHNNIVRLTFGNNTMTSKIPMLDGDTAKKYKYNIMRSTGALGKRFKSDSLGVLDNSITQVITVLVADIVTFI